MWVAPAAAFAASPVNLGDGEIILAIGWREGVDRAALA
jgi:hypothetical protein